MLEPAKLIVLKLVNPYRGDAMGRRICVLLFLNLSALFLAGDLAWGDWPQWRGPSGTGIAANATPPLEWSRDKNVLWKVELDGEGNSSPIVVGDKLFLAHSPKDSQSRSLRCYARANGELLWTKTVEFKAKEATHKTNPYCSSSPTSDGERVVVWHGSAGVFCYDLNGELLWKRDLGPVDHVWGYGSSPVISGNVVLLNYGPGTNAFVVAMNKKTGEDVWRKEYAGMKSAKPGDFHGSWSTPVIYKEGNETAALLSLPHKLLSVNVANGGVIWSCDGLSKLAYTSPLLESNVVVAMCGYHGPSIAVKTGGKGDVTETHRLWRADKNVPQRVGSGVLVNGQIYILNESGVMWCKDSLTGELQWEGRLGKGKSWSSVVYAAGRLYATNMEGTTIVLSPNSKKCEVLAENKLGELTRGSPAFVDGQVYLRTYESLIAIGEGG
jgi:outer membrane protein assembly factor BamB